MVIVRLSAGVQGRSRPALALALALLGCPASAPPPRPAPLVLIVGCEALDGPRCVAAPAQELTLWVRSPRDAHLTLEWEGVAADPGWVFAEDGLRGTFSPARPDGELTVRDRDLDWRWTITLAPALEPAPAPALARARALRGERRLPEALAALEEATPGLYGAGEVEALMLRGASSSTASTSTTPSRPTSAPIRPRSPAAWSAPPAGSP